MTDLGTIDECLAAGDLYGAVRALSALAATASLEELLAPLRRAAVVAEFTDLAGAADAVAAAPDDPTALYRLGYACVERNVPAVAIAALTRADRRAPGRRGIITELVAAYESCDRYADAVALLAANDRVLVDWPDRYLAVVNAIQAGDLDTARRYGSVLSTPDGDWAHAGQRIDGMLARAALLDGGRLDGGRLDGGRLDGGRLDERDLRGWHFVLNGSVLATVSPYGFDEGMTGRYAFIQDSPAACRRSLDRLATALRLADAPPLTVSLLPDRSSQIFGLAAAAVLGLPAEPFAPGRTGTVVVAYDLRDCDSDTLRALWGPRPAGTVLVEQATCWTGPPAIAADLTGFLHQVVVTPWGARLTGGPERTPPDDRPAEQIAAEIAAAAPDPAEETGPGDSDEDYARFVTAVRAAWPPSGARDRVFSPGPVRSSRFA